MVGVLDAGFVVGVIDAGLVVGVIDAGLVLGVIDAGLVLGVRQIGGFSHSDGGLRSWQVGLSGWCGTPLSMHTKRSCM